MRSTPLQALALAALLAQASTSWADIISVDALSSDDVIVNGLCTCREAIENANNDAPTNTDCAGGSGDDVIVLPAGTLNLTSPCRPSRPISP